MCFYLSLVYHTPSPNPLSLSHPTLPHSHPTLSHSHPNLPHTFTQPFLTLSPNPPSHSHPTLPTLSLNPSKHPHPTLPHSLTQPSLTLSPNSPSPFSFHTAPLAPRNLALQVTSSQSIRVSWTRPLFFRGQLLRYEVCVCLDM